MDHVLKWHGNESKELEYPVIKDLGQRVDEICMDAVAEARAELHPLVGSLDLIQLEKREEFVGAFRLALEQHLAAKIAAWQPVIQAVFRFDESWMESRQAWDGSIHLLAKVPRLSNAIKLLGRQLDRVLLKHLGELNWQRFKNRSSILEVQQVTTSELRHGISYGAMFAAAHSAPVKVWPLQRDSR